MRGLAACGVLVMAALVACATAGGEVSGGQTKLETAPPAFNPPTTETDAAPPASEGSGAKWSDLYRDLFGPTGRAPSCSFQSDCHGSAEAEGAKSPAGIECFDQSGCRQSFFDKGLLKPDDKNDPGNSVLLAGLLRVKRADGSINGYMPEEPESYVFSEQSVERIKEWIKNGAPND